MSWLIDNDSLNLMEIIGLVISILGITILSLGNNVIYDYFFCCYDCGQGTVTGYKKTPDTGQIWVSHQGR